MDKDDLFELVATVIASTVLAVAFSFYYGLFQCKGDIMMKEIFVQYIVPALIGCGATLLCTLIGFRHTQVKKNTEAIEKFSRQLGLKDDITLSKEILDKYEKLSCDIGREDDATLTKQHDNINASILEKFSVIQSRYDKEDYIYRTMTTSQRELKDTLDSFSQEYAEAIKNESGAKYKLYKLLEENKELRDENKELYNRIQELQPKREKDRGLSR